MGNAPIRESSAKLVCSVEGGDPAASYWCARQGFLSSSTIIAIFRGLGPDSEYGVFEIVRATSLGEHDGQKLREVFESKELRDKSLWTSRPILKACLTFDEVVALSRCRFCYFSSGSSDSHHISASESEFRPVRYVRSCGAWCADSRRAMTMKDEIIWNNSNCMRSMCS